MLDTHLQSLLESFTVPATVKVILNEGLLCKDSVDICFKHKVESVVLDFNSGTLGVDFGASMIRTPYVTVSNDDFLFHPGWIEDVISLIEKYYPASASCSLVEPFFSNNPVVFFDNLGDTLQKAYRPFLENRAAGKYKLRQQISYTHPITVKTEDYFAVGGYSGGFNWDYWPGWSLDDAYCARLYKLHKGFRSISSANSFVYHLSSQSNKKLDPASKAKNNREVFQREFGVSIEEFRRNIGCFSLVE